MKEFKIGSIEVDTNKTIKTITLGTLRLKTTYDIELYTSEGYNIPHFHVVPKDKKKLVVCIKLYEASYFPHGNKIGTLNADECKILNAFLKDSCKISEAKDLDYTNWQYMVYKWRQSHNEPYSSDVLKEIFKNQPDYTTMPDYK